MKGQVMTESKKSRIKSLIPDGRLEKVKLLLSLLLTLLLTVTAVCFIVSCVSIYRNGGDTPFSRDTVADHLKKIAPISFVSIGFAIAVGIISLFTVEPKVKNIPIRKKTILSLLRKRLEVFSTSAEYVSFEKEEKKRRQITVLSALALSLIFTVAALIFVLNPSRYSLDDINTDIAYAVVIASVSTLLIFAVCFVATYFLDSSYDREIKKTKEEISSLNLNGAKITPTAEELRALSSNEGHTVTLVRIIVLAVAVTFIILGIFNGGMADVLGKAVRICTECIGLG